MKSSSNIFSYSSVIYVRKLEILKKSLLEKVLTNNRILYVNLITLINQFNLTLKLLLISDTTINECILQ